MDRARFRVYEVRYLVQNTVQFLLIIVNVYGYNFFPADQPYLDQAINVEWILIVTLPAYTTIFANRCDVLPFLGFSIEVLGN